VQLAAVVDRPAHVRDHDVAADWDHVELDRDLAELLHGANAAARPAVGDERDRLARPL
jgi:hypothetical protein